MSTIKLVFPSWLLHILKLSISFEAKETTGKRVGGGRGVHKREPSKGSSVGLGGVGGVAEWR